MEDRLIKLSEVAKMLGVSKSTLRRWDLENVLKSVQITPLGLRLYRLSDIQKLIEGKTNGK